MADTRLQSKQLLDDLIYNIIHDTVSKAHRGEKLARMQSAALEAKKEAEKVAAEEEANKSPTKVNGFVKPPTAGSAEPAVKVETTAATYNNGKVFLKGNPLKTQKEVICPDCHLPRLLYPTSGIGARAPPDPKKEYCKNQPPIRKPGCDVYGNPFVTDKPSYKGKKKQQTTTSTPATSGPSSPTSANGTGGAGNVPGEKPTFPYAKCPNNCERYLIITRMAHHLDSCIGLSGRQSGRNAMAKITGTSTPKGDSRASTPKPVVSNKRGREADSPETGSVKKKKKVTLQKKAATAAAAAPVGKVTPSKKPPSKLKNGVSAQEDRTAAGNDSDSVTAAEKAD